MNFIQKRIEAHKFFKWLKSGKSLNEIASAEHLEESYIYDLLQQHYSFLELNEAMLYTENTIAKNELRTLLKKRSNIVLYGDSSIDKFAFVKNLAKEQNLLVDVYTMGILNTPAKFFEESGSSYLVQPLEIYDGKIIVLRDINKFDWKDFHTKMNLRIPFPIIIITDSIEEIPRLQSFEYLELKSITFSNLVTVTYPPWEVAGALLNLEDREKCHQMIKSISGNWTNCLYYLRAGIAKITEPTLRYYNYDILKFVFNNKHIMNREYLISYLVYGIIPSYRKITWLKPYYFGKKQEEKKVKKYKKKITKSKKKLAKQQRKLEVWL